METPEFIQHQYIEFRKLYRIWFKDLSSTFMDFKKATVKYYKDHMDESHVDIVSKFFSNVRGYLEVLSEMDNSFFDNCGEFYNCIQYSEMMATEQGRAEEFRKSQMVYLNKLCYMAIMLTDFNKNTKTETAEGESLEEPESDYTPLLLKFFTNIQTLDGTNMENLMKNFENAFSAENFNDADKAFIHDNPLLSELAEEISKEIKIPESFKSIQNPQDIFKLMFNKEGKEFMEGMVKSVGNKIQHKINNGQIDEKDLFSQAQKMMGTVFSNNPMFSGMPGMPGMGAFSGDGEAEEAEDETTVEQKKAELRNKLKQNLKGKRNTF
jgi:transcriptional regulator of heat shock response